MTVQVTVTTTVVGELEVELASASFGHVEPLDLDMPEAPVKKSIDRVLEPESSILAPGLSLPVG